MIVFIAAASSKWPLDITELCRFGDALGFLAIVSNDGTRGLPGLELESDTFPVTHRRARGIYRLRFSIKGRIGMRGTGLYGGMSCLPVE